MGKYGNESIARAKTKTEFSENLILGINFGKFLQKFPKKEKSHIFVRFFKGGKK